MTSRHSNSTRSRLLLACALASLLAGIPGAGAFGQTAPRAAASAPTPEPVTMPLRADRPADATALVPTLTLYQAPPAHRSGALVVVCPGGGYAGLAAHEGEPIARWLNELGITAVVLRYRHGATHPHPEPLDDAARAIRLARHHAADWQVDPKRVAILGFSAGGHLASTAGTHFDLGRAEAADPVDRQSSRPDRMILIYPVITMQSPETHAGSRRNLLGANPDPALVASLSNETQITPQTPPAFLVHTADDSVVTAENSLRFALALQQAHVPVELHLFEHGPHGFGLARSNNPKDPPVCEWSHLCERWLGAQGFTSPSATTAR